MIGEPVEHLLVSGSDADERGIGAKHAELSAAVEQLRELLDVRVNLLARETPPEQRTDRIHVGRRGGHASKLFERDVDSIA